MHSVSSVSAASPRKLGGLLTRKERWALSPLGWIVFLLMICIACGAGLILAHPFLAVTDRVDADVLVVENWVHEFAIRAAVDEFRTGHYKHVFTTGGPAVGANGDINASETAAIVNLDWLRYKGMPPEVLQAVPTFVVGHDRTYHSAVALRDWFSQHNMAVHSLNVVSETAHARRTRLLYEKAFGNKVKIGIIAAPNPDYDSRKWWLYSDGFRDVVGEGLAYLYAKLLFHPQAVRS